MKNIVIATIKSWNIANAEQFSSLYADSYNVTIISDRDKMSLETIRGLNPQYVFFPHWSWLIPEEIYSEFECVVFHMSDLPYGRGGSPLQNLILEKKYNTKISALKVTGEVDGGPVYLKTGINIAEGDAGEILSRASEVVFSQMIPAIIEGGLKPEPQVGEVVKFKRRDPEDGNLLTADLKSLIDYYDFIRMLDGEGYPRAFIDNGSFRIEFENIKYDGNRLTGKFIIDDNGE